MSDYLSSRYVKNANTVMIDKFPHAFYVRKKKFLGVLCLWAILILLNKFYIDRLLMIPIIFLMGLYFAYLFIDSSLKFNRTNSKNSIFRNINLPHVKCYTAKIKMDHGERSYGVQNDQIMGQNSLGGVFNGKKRGMGRNKSPNAIFFQNTKSDVIVGTMGFELEASALHILPNYDDFLRRLQSLHSFVPTTIQIDFINREGITQIKYGVLFSRHISSPTMEKISELFHDLRKIHSEFKVVLVNNFPHFKFVPLEGKNLLHTIIGVGMAEQSPINSKIINSNGDTKMGDNLGGNNDVDGEGLKMIDFMEKLYHLILTNKWGKFLIFIVVNALVFIYLNVANSHNNVKIFKPITYFVLILSVISVLRMKSKQELLGDQFPTIPTLKLTDLQSGLFFEHTNEDDLYFFEPNTKDVYLKRFYTVGKFNQYFNFINVKFYRDIMQRVANSDISISIQFHLARINEDEIERYEEYLTNSFQQEWNYSEDKHELILRKACGFYKFQPIICLSRRYSYETFKNVKKIASVDNIDEVLMPVLSNAFPSCEIIPLPKSTYLQVFTKSRYFSALGTNLPLHFTTGDRLSSFVKIPDEIHKSAKSYYPAEFSTPFLNDDIIFGKSFNVENCSFEGDGGLTNDELTKNILICGNDYDEYHKRALQIMSSLIRHNNSAIIFDWDGSATQLVGMLDTTIHQQNINIYVPGNNISLRIFDPFETHIVRKSPYYSYINDVYTIIEQLFDITGKDISIVQNLISEVLDTPGPITIKTIYDRFYELYGERGDIQKLSNELLSLINGLKNGIYHDIYDESLDSRKGLLDSIFDPNKTMIINLTDLPDMNYKMLFVEVFLSQLCILQKMMEKKKLLKPVFIPRIDMLVPGSNRIRHQNKVISLFDKLKTQKIPIIAECSHVSLINNKAISEFNTIFAFQTKDRLDLNELFYMLELDDSFTNTFTHSKRHKSYQLEFLKNLKQGECIIYRQHLGRPYVFKVMNEYLDDFDEKINFNDSSTRIIRDFMPDHETIVSVGGGKKYQITQQNASVPSLEMDLAKFPSYIEGTFNFLKYLEENLMIAEIFPLHDLKDDLYDYLVPSFERKKINEFDSQKKCSKIINCLINCEYLIKTTITNQEIQSDLSETHGYMLSNKAKKMLNSVESLSPISKDHHDDGKYHQNSYSYDTNEMFSDELNDVEMEKNLELNSNTDITSYSDDMNEHNGEDTENQSLEEIEHAANMAVMEFRRKLSSNYSHNNVMEGAFDELKKEFDEISDVVSKYEGGEKVSSKISELHDVNIAGYNDPDVLKSKIVGIHSDIIELNTLQTGLFNKFK